jgi:acetylornithine deacetylase/succinyl-diaminopimelate desuccinylase-like protein
MLAAGHAENALPQRARATIQCRLLPGESPAAVRDTLTPVVADMQVQVSLDGEPGGVTRVPPQARGHESHRDSDPGELARRHRPSRHGSLVERWRHLPPRRHTGLRRLGRVHRMDDYRAHGKDERTEVQAFYEGVEFMYRLMRALAQ